MDAALWMASLHGGHSGEFCEHASGTLRATVEAAIGAGLRVHGLSEHAPRPEERFLYSSEREKGYTVERLERQFEAYATESLRLQDEFAEQIAILRGFETEVVPTGSYANAMRALRDRHAFDYIVGSVHHVAEISIDESRTGYQMAVEKCGGFEPFAVRYYQQVQRMIEELQPEIVAHLDLLRLHAPAGSDLAAPPIRKAAEAALRAARAGGCILDVNTAAWRKGLDEPYPAPWIVTAAAEEGVPLCLGDDSHAPSQVGFALDRARHYLLGLGVKTVTVLERSDSGLARREARLEPYA